MIRKLQLKLSLFTLCLVTFSTLLAQLTLPTNPDFIGNFAMIAKLSGQNEVPAVTTPGIGYATITFTDNFTTARIQCTVTGLSAAITGAHIHVGAEGTKGGVVFNLTNQVVNNKINSSFAITKAQLKTMLEGGYYVNVHTTANPGGEVRGQLKLDAPESFIVVASAAEEVPTNSSAGQALASITYNPGNNIIAIKMLATDMTGPITAAHFHKAAVGVNGSVVQNLGTFLNGTTINTKFKAGTYIDDLRSGGLYLNLHTSMFPGGEIRGQILPVSGIAFDGWMNGAQENPAINTRAKGLFVGRVLTSLDSISSRGLTDSLSGAITAAHIHTAAQGTNGGVIINFGSTIVGKKFANGVTSAITTAQFSDLLKGRLYFNVHTAANSGGEVRGQLYSTARESYSVDMCQISEVPPVNAGNAIGAAYFSYSRDLDEAVFNTIYTNLTGPITGGHIHNGAKGTNGPVVYNFGSQAGNGGAFITLDTLFTPTLYNLIKSGNAYVNFHTAANPGGEIRGQLEKYNTCTLQTSTIDQLSVKTFTIYPNPVADILTIVADIPSLDHAANSHTSSTGMYRILDSTGKTVLTSDSPSINVSSLSKGFYMVTIPSAVKLGVVKFMKL